MKISDLGNTTGTPPNTPLASAPVPKMEGRTGWRKPLTWFALVAGVLLLCFVGPIFELVDFSKHSDFFSYIPLMPFITGYLIWIRRSKLQAGVRHAWAAAAAAAAAGVAVLAAYGWAFYQGWFPVDEDYLAIMVTALLLLLLAAGFACVGAKNMAAVAFPVFMLVFMVPYPKPALDRIELFFQQTSAVAASGMLHLAGTAVFRHGLGLTLPDVLPNAVHPEKGMTLMVQPECSGIHSSQVLLITSLLAGNLFLNSPWKRLVLAVFVIPLAILRNGFRIFTLGELCVHINRTMIDSPIHHQGGPIFFALSLIPFFIFLVWLRKSELKTGNPVKPLDNS